MSLGKFSISTFIYLSFRYLLLSILDTLFSFIILYPSIFPFSLKLTCTCIGVLFSLYPFGVEVCVIVYVTVSFLYTFDIYAVNVPLASVTGFPIAVSPLSFVMLKVTSESYLTI